MPLIRVNRQLVIDELNDLAHQKQEMLLGNKTHSIEEITDSEEALGSIEYCTSKLFEYRRFCKLLKEPSQGNGRVDVGSLLKVREDGEESLIFIIDSTPFETVDVTLKNGIVCELTTPDNVIAKALKDHHRGETVAVPLPKMTRTIEVLSVM